MAVGDDDDRHSAGLLSSIDRHDWGWLQPQSSPAASTVQPLPASRIPKTSFKPYHVPMLGSRGKASSSLTLAALVQAALDPVKQNCTRSRVLFGT
uniref:B2126_C3_259 n=1 Tax=Mycobacterium leprae TaxID=1769 RepID=Q49791_MYCLR|nr:B2126_C3_259 [Mycobacterium leprae]